MHMSLTDTLPNFDYAAAATQVVDHVQCLIDRHVSRLEESAKKSKQKKVKFEISVWVLDSLIEDGEWPTTGDMSSVNIKPIGYSGIAHRPLSAE
jgi:hypothetical protein